MLKLFQEVNNMPRKDILQFLVASILLILASAGIGLSIALLLTGNEFYMKLLVIDIVLYLSLSVVDRFIGE